MPSRNRALCLALALAVLAMTCVVVADPVYAADELTATPTSTARVAPNTTTTLDGLSVANGVDTLQVTLSTTAGQLDFPTTAGLTLGFNNAWTGRNSVSFTGTQSAINDALAAVQLVAPATNTTATVELTVLPYDSNYFYLSSNGHFYRYYNPGPVTWSSADALARGTSFRGQPGYLVTIPDAVVNDFLSYNLPGAQNIWTAGVAYQNRQHNGTTYATVWKWAEGTNQSPVQGTTFTVCTNTAGACSFVDAGSFFSSWTTNEPNMSGTPPEAYMGTNYQGVPGKWNDFHNGNPNVTGYVVEYGGKTNTDPTLGTGFAGVVTASSDVLIAPEPTVPAAPSPQAVPGDRSVSLSFRPPGNGGSTITSYEVRVDGGSWVTLPTTESSAVVDGTIVYTRTGVVGGLSNGTSYVFRVRAVNAVGAGPESDPVTSTPVSVPGAPDILDAVPANASVAVSFTAPVDTGGSPILDYLVVASSGGASTTCATSPCAISGLTNGTEYSFAVTARNAVGSGAASASVLATPRTVPQAPTNVSADPGNGAAEITFDPPTDDGGATITGYRVSTSPATDTTDCDGSPCSVAGLTNGVSYAFDVVATNAAGDSAAGSSAAVTPATVPGEPTDLSVESGDGQVTLTFDAPASDGGDGITGYTVTYQPGSGTASCAGSPCVVTGLTNGTGYTFTIHAINTVGDGPESSVAATTPAAVPSAPLDPTAVRGNQSAVVSFSDPASDGGATITSYRVTASPGGAEAVCAGSPCAVSGLTNGTEYSFTIAAINAAGTGAASEPTNSVTPATVPDAPTEPPATVPDAPTEPPATVPDAPTEPPSRTFVDVADDSPHRDGIYAIVEAGITKGCDASQTRFCPHDPVRRDQMATFLARAMDPPPAQRDHFSDGSGLVHEPAINALYEAGVINGCTTTRFCPALPITRAQLSALVDRALQLPPATRDYFVDDESSIHESSINRLAEAGIIRGYGDGRFDPDGRTLRAHMATYIARAFGLTATS